MIFNAMGSQEIGEVHIDGEKYVIEEMTRFIKRDSRMIVHMMCKSLEDNNKKELKIELFKDF